MSANLKKKSCRRAWIFRHKISMCTIGQRCYVHTELLGAISLDTRAACAEPQPPSPCRCAVHTGWRKKRGHPISLQIFWKIHDQTAWKLVNFCNIIESMLNTVINFLFKNFIALWRRLAKTQLLSFIHTVQIDLSITRPVNSASGNRGLYRVNSRPKLLHIYTHTCMLHRPTYEYIMRQ